jgi:hypothetical protein
MQNVVLVLNSLYGESSKPEHSSIHSKIIQQITSSNTKDSRSIPNKDSVTEEENTLEVDSIEDGPQCLPWTIKTKYYRAQITFWLDSIISTSYPNKPDITVSADHNTSNSRTIQHNITKQSQSDGRTSSNVIREWTETVAEAVDGFIFVFDKSKVSKEFNSGYHVLRFKIYNYSWKHSVE